MALMVLAVSECLFAADIHDDVVVWLRGDSDLNGDGIVQVGEVVDALSPTATDAIKPNGWLDGTVTGVSGDFVWTNDAVVCPYTSRTIENAKSYCFRQSVRTSNSGSMPNTISLDSSILSKITSNAWSFHIRFKWKGATVSPQSNSSQIAYIGNSSSASAGHGFVLYLTTDGHMTCAIGSSHFMTYNTRAIQLSSNVWTDVVFTMTDTNVVQWSVMQAGGTLKTGSCTPSDTKFRPNPAGKAVIGNASVRTSWEYYLTSGVAKEAFIGEVAEFAMWNRALSPEDRLRVMAWPNEDLFRAGIANGASAEFSGEGAVSSSPLSPDCGWGAFGGDIAAGASKNIAFTVPLRYDNLPQMFRWRGAVGSASGTIRLEVNGTSVGTASVGSGHWTRILVPGSLLRTGGTTTLTIVRTDAGASPLKADAIVLGGSWQEGTVSGNQWENDDNSATQPYYVPDGNFKHFRATIKAGKRQTVRFDMPHELAGRYKFKVAYKMLFEGTPANIKVVAYVNGKKLYEEVPNSRAWWTREFKVPANAIAEGENLLTFANEGNAGDTSSYVSFDYLRLLIDKEEMPTLFVVR